jgi:hypothetical protein
VRLRLFLGSVVGTFVLLLMLCLGSQNLTERRVVNLGVGRTVPLPQGFVVGMAILCGAFSGSASVALLGPNQED